MSALLRPCRALLCGLALLAGAACDLVNLPQIEVGRTTQAEVRARLGAPDFIHRDADGGETWEYTRQPMGTRCYMIGFAGGPLVSRFEQVLNDANFAAVRPGMSRDDIRRRFGAPASRQTFVNLGEEVWEWRIDGMPPTEETYFGVHFGLDGGGVVKTSRRVAQH